MKAQLCGQLCMFVVGLVRSAPKVDIFCVCVCLLLVRHLLTSFRWMMKAARVMHYESQLSWEKQASFVFLRLCPSETDASDVVCTVMLSY